MSDENWLQVISSFLNWSVNIIDIHFRCKVAFIISINQVTYSFNYQSHIQSKVNGHVFVC
jgi:hypothetical protein